MTNQNPLSIAITSTFTIQPELTHSPIVKKLVMPTQFCLTAIIIPTLN